MTRSDLAVVGKCFGCMVQDFRPFEIVDGNKSAGLVLLCDHARNTLPDESGSLGLPASEFERHRLKNADNDARDALIKNMTSYN